MTHPITPPPELVRQWMERIEYDEHTWFYESYIAEQAAQWGADQELEACCEWTTANFGELPGQNLYLFRRLKPPSLKKQALALIDGCTDQEGDYLDDNALSIIRRALEALPDD